MRVPEPAVWRGTLAQQMVLASFWFSLNFQGSALMTIVLPEALLRRAGPAHTADLARLAALAAAVAVTGRPLAGWLSDRIRRRGGRRQHMVAAGALLDTGGLYLMAVTGGLRDLVGGFVLVAVGSNVAEAAYEVLLPEWVPGDQRGQAAGYMGAAVLLGTIGGLGTGALLPAAAVLRLMMLAVTAGAVTVWLGVRPGAAVPAAPAAAGRGGVPRDFALAFLVRFLVTFGQVLLMTFILYFVRDVLHLTRPASGTAGIAMLALLGAVLASLGMGRWSDRSGRPLVVALSGLPMAAAVLGFALWPRLDAMLGFAVLYGLGYGAFLSTGWALALDTLPRAEHMGQDLGWWGTASNVPAVVAPLVGGWILGRFPRPATGYRVLFLLAAASFLTASGAALAVGRRREAGAEPRLPWGRALLARALAAAIWTYARLRYRIHLQGRLPAGPGPVLVVANHLHDLEGLVLPAWLGLARPWRLPLYLVASQRLFEPGFLGDRLGGTWGRLLAWVPLPQVLTALGVLPVENQLHRRPLRSVAYEVYQRHGDRPLGTVFLPRALDGLDPAAPLRVLWGDRARAARAEVTPAVLQSPYRAEVIASLRPRVEAQLAAITARFRQGGILFLTPEGRMSASGAIGRLRLLWDRLAPLARAVVGVAVTYDPWAPGPLTCYCRLIPIPAGADLQQRLAAARPVVPSQVWARVFRRHPQGVADRQQALKAA
ncbi:MAG: MFS transporter, partial [Firmicutes bacterium]|nr:MFS transporter [Bacillota bacterium]